MKNDFMGVIFTNHALERLKERQVKQSDAWYTFKHPDQQAKGRTKNSYKYSKSFGTQKIEVIAKKNKEGKWVILSVWSKLVGNNRPIFKSNSWLNRLKKLIRNN